MSDDASIAQFNVLDPLQLTTARQMIADQVNDGRVLAMASAWLSLPVNATTSSCPMRYALQSPCFRKHGKRWRQCLVG